MRKIKLLIICLLLTTGAFAQSGIFYNVKDYGAKGDGQTNQQNNFNITIR